MSGIDRDQPGRPRPRAFASAEGRRHPPGEIVATPASLLLAEARRALWAGMGEPERPPEPELGRHDDEIATGPPLECQQTDPDLSFSEWHHRQDQRNALAAEAQRAWEEKARVEAEAWKRRLDGEGGAAGEGEGK